nr:RHS repeat-associated core domain-containing protein [Photorhabdus bodei]
MQEKQFLAEGCRLALTTYRWNSQNQLTGLITPDGIPWEYRYDAFGRRTEKRCIQSGKRTTYLWDGDVPAEIRDYQHGRLKMIRHLVFDGWELIAQQTQQFTLNLDNRVELMAGEVQTQYAVSAPTGEPLALFDPAGKRVWRRPKQSLYGLRLTGPGENPQLDPGLRFAGQIFDEESGLFYNRFRYYLPEGCCYLSADPLGLNGGPNPYAYVHNPANWIDPLGLSSKKCGTGEYKDVGGHHIHAKAGFKDNVSYDPKRGFSISQDYMAKNKLDHQLMTNHQRSAFKELKNSGSPNTLQEHTKIAVDALEAGGASTQQARNLVAESLWNLRNQGVRVPSNIPWYK